MTDEAIDVIRLLTTQATSCCLAADLDARFQKVFDEAAEARELDVQRLPADALDNLGYEPLPLPVRCRLSRGGTWHSEPLAGLVLDADTLTGPVTEDDIDTIVGGDYAGWMSKWLAAKLLAGANALIDGLLRHDARLMLPPHIHMERRAFLLRTCPWVHYFRPRRSP